MSRIDDELLEAVQIVDPPAVASPPPRHRTSRRNTRRNLGLLLALGVAASLLAALVFTSFNDAAVYSKSVDQLVASRDKLVGRSVRVDGILVHGSLLRRDYPCEYRFKLIKNGAVLEVRFPQCIVPDTFRDRPEAEVGVTVEGKLSEEGTFEASQIMAKCPSKYEEKNGRKVPVGLQDTPTM